MDSRIIEVGCGAAHLARELVSRHPTTEAVGIEVDERQLAKNLLVPTERLRFEKAGAQAIPFPDASFDGALMLKSLHHVPMPLMDQAGVRHLVIDLRRNEGGDDGLGLALLSHLIKTTFTRAGNRRESAYERVPYVLARYLDTWDFSFFDRTGQVSKGPSRNWLMPDSPARIIESASPHFDGQVVALIGPQNSSAGYLIARDLQRAGAATLIGQPTGGNLRGLNGGQLAWITLPASGVAVDIPLVANFTAGAPPDVGVKPDVLVESNFEDTQAGGDAGMAAARAWLQR